MVIFLRSCAEHLRIIDYIPNIQYFTEIRHVVLSGLGTDETFKLYAHLLVFISKAPTKQVTRNCCSQGGPGMRSRTRR